MLLTGLFFLAMLSIHFCEVRYFTALASNPPEPGPRTVVDRYPDPYRILRNLPADELAQHEGDKGRVSRGLTAVFTLSMKLTRLLVIGAGLLVTVNSAMLIRAWVLLRREERRKPAEKRPTEGDPPRRE